MISYLFKWHARDFQQVLGRQIYKKCLVCKGVKFAVLVMKEYKLFDYIFNEICNNK